MDRLCLDAPVFHTLFAELGPSLAVWRAAEVAVLREQTFDRPIIDLGCGDGLVTALAVPHVEIALDPDRQGLAKAERRGIYDRFEPCLAEEAPIEKGSMGTVLSNSVLEHVKRIDDVLAVSAGWLRPGGRLVFTVPTEAFALWLAIPSASYARRRNRQLIHLNLWTAEEWGRRLDAAGLEIETVRPYMRRRLVMYWDAMDILERVWIARWRLVGLAWRRISPAGLERLSRRAARLDLASQHPGGGRLIVAKKR